CMKALRSSRNRQLYCSPTRQNADTLNLFISALRCFLKTYSHKIRLWLYSILFMIELRKIGIVIISYFCFL
ncbi:MAG: hypothetical protein ACI9P5_004599, partial [Saprospiraceae bacterium]